MLIRTLRAYLRPYTGSVGLVLVLQLVQAVATLYLPSLNADIIDTGVVAGDTDYILRIGALMLGVTAVQGVASVAATYVGARTAMSLGRDLRAAVFHRVQSFSAREVNHFTAPSLITRTTNDVQQVQQLTMMGFTLMLTAPIMGVGGIVMAMREDVPLSGLLLVVVPLLLVLVALVVRKMHPLFRAMQDRIDTVNRVLREQITGIRVIRAFVRDGHEQARFARANTELFDVSLGTGRWMAFMFPMVFLVVNMSSVAVVWFGGHRVASGGMEVGELTAFLSYLVQILMSVMMATFMFIMLPRAEVCAERIQEVLDTESSLTVPADPVRRTPQPGHLDLEDVGYHYPGADEPVLQGVTLHARPGETTAVIGSTGSGKTTVVHLLARLMDATAGTVRVGGVDVKDLDPAVLSASVGLVPQRPYLFSGTVASNLRYGRPDATDAELWHALEVAQAKGFVQALPEQLDAPIAQGGTNVSGGQRQRLAIARMLVARPQIHVFDDSFSALDYATDAALRAALRAETRESTVVIVAQRVSTIRDADRIVVLDAGRVVGVGTHPELMASNATYREIVLSQLTEEEAA